MIVFDIETQNWDIYVLGAIKDESETRVYRDPKLLFLDILSRAGETVWSWNGGRYDILWFLDLCVKYGIPAEVSLAGSRVVRAKCGVKGQEVELRDAMAFCPLSLNKAAAMIGEKKIDADDYSWIRLDMPACDWARLETYLRHDVEITYKTLDYLFTYCRNNRIEIAGTVGTSSWKTLAQECNVPAIKWPDRRVYNYCRRGYYGGRVQVFRNRSKRIWRYDINSAYPWSLSVTELPTGDRIGLNSTNAGVAYRDGKIGIYRCVVNVPPMHIPPLPMRLRGRLCYPTGEFVGTWTDIELRYAESVGVHIVKFLDGFTWTSKEAKLAPFMGRIWNLRDLAGKETSLGVFLKFVANAPCGKVAQQPERENVLINPDLGDVLTCPAAGFCHNGEWCGMIGACCRHLCTGDCGRWNLISKLGSIWSYPSYRIPDCGYVHWGAFLTAPPRIRVHQALMIAGEASVYCDTDAVYAEKELDLDIGPELGQFAFEGQGGNWIALAPKTYAYFDEVKSKDKAKAKGMPGITADTLREWFDWHPPKTMPAVKMDRGVRGFREIARANESTLFKRRDTSRIHHGKLGLVGDRRLLPDGSTRSLDAQEAMALLTER